MVKNTPHNLARPVKNTDATKSRFITPKMSTTFHIFFFYVGTSWLPPQISACKFWPGFWAKTLHGGKNKLFHIFFNYDPKLNQVSTSSILDVAFWMRKICILKVRHSLSSITVVSIRDDIFMPFSTYRDPTQFSTQLGHLT